MTVRIDPSNAEQLRQWDGESGAYWTEHARRHEEMVAAHRARLLDAAAIAPTDRVLDVGCGSGRTTRDAARRATAGSALGVDLSSAMLALARRTTEQERVPNATFLQADAQVHPFDAGAFDVVISQMGVMFFGDTVAAFAYIGRALRPGGRLAVLTWQPFERNEWFRAVFTALAAGRPLAPPPPHPPSPFGLSDPDGVRRVLADAGFVDVALTDQRAPMHIGPDVEDAFGFLLGQLGWIVGDADAPTRERALADLRRSLTEHLTERGVVYGSAAWLVQARRP